MTAITILLGISALCSGLFAGFILAMLSVVEQTLRGLSAERYAHTMQGIITNGRKSHVVLILLLLPIPTTLVALTALPLNEVFILAFAGALVYLSASLLVSNRIAEPLYDTMMAWSPDAPPDDWQVYRKRWFRINQLRFAGSLIGCVLYALAIQRLTLYI